MGLDISAGGYRFRAGSYSGFNKFRDWLTKAAGYEGIEDYWIYYNEILHEWNTRAGMNRRAGEVFLGPLIGHSDCDGYITAANARKLLKDLQEVKEQLPDINTIKITTPTHPLNEREIEQHMRDLLDHWIKACQEVLEMGGRECIYFH